MEESNPLNNFNLKKEVESSMNKPQPGWRWRSSAWFLTLVVASSVGTDGLTYAFMVPVLPFRLQDLGYENVSVLTSWTLFSYSIGLAVFSFPVAFYFHRYPYRRGPMVGAVVILEGAMILFMLVKPYGIMIVARVLQGAAAAVVFSVGFALLCENIPEKKLGRLIGFANSGGAVGFVMGPPIGGALYPTLGWYAPFVFCIILCAFDLVLRLLVIEKRYLPETCQKELEGREREPETADQDNSVVASNSTISRDCSGKGLGNRPLVEIPHGTTSDHQHNVTSEMQSEPIDMSLHAKMQHTDQKAKERDHDEGKRSPKELSPWGVLVKLLSSPRGLTAISMTTVFGFIISAYDPILTLHVETEWNKGSKFVGLLYMAACLPTCAAGPIAGILADKFGAEWVGAPPLILTLPWIVMMMRRDSVAGFIVYYALAGFFLSWGLSTSGVEVAKVAKETEGISVIRELTHGQAYRTLMFLDEFAAINVAFAISTSLGAIAGGQIYAHVGWNSACWFCFACCAATIPATLVFTGDKPLLYRLVDWTNRSRR